MTLGYGLLTIGALFIYTSIKNMSIRDIVLDRPGPGQPEDIAPELEAGIGAGAGTGKGGGSKLGKVGGGSWGGTKDLAYKLTRGMPKGSEKRSTQSTASGNISDHWEGCKECYAIDVPASGATGTKYAKTIVKRAGGNYSGGPISQDFTVKGYRVQVLWLVADHYDHVHVGVRKLGYTP